MVSIFSLAEVGRRVDKLILLFLFLSEPANLLLDNPNDMYIEPATDCVLSYCELRGKVEYKKHYC